MKEELEKTFELLGTFRKITKIVKKSSDYNQCNYSEIFLFINLWEKEQEQDKYYSCKELAQKMNMSPQSFSRFISSLENKQMVKKIHKDSSRKVYIKLEDNAKEILKEKYQEIIYFLEEVVNKMGIDDVNILIEKINKFYLIVEEDVKKCYN